MLSLSVTEQDEAYHLFDQVNELIDTPPGLSDDDIWYVQNPVMQAWNTVRVKYNWPDTIKGWYRKMNTAEYRSNFYTPTTPSHASRELMSDAPIEPLPVVDATSNPSNPSSLVSITSQNIPSSSGNPLPGGVPASKPTPLFSVTRPSIPSDTREIRVNE
jgi:hypothetical protein